MNAEDKQVIIVIGVLAAVLTALLSLFFYMIF